MLEALVTSGRAIDVVLVVMLAEAVWLWHRRRSTPVAIAVALLPGAFILLAVRAALADAPWVAVAVPLALSFPIHLYDLRRRGWVHPERRA